MPAMFVIVLLAPFLSAVLLLVNQLLATVKIDPEKGSTYECGFLPLRGQTRAPFAISFFLIAVLFITFDLEVATLMPLSSSMLIVGEPGYWTVFVFFWILTFGFVVEIGTGALNLTDQRSNHHNLNTSFGTDQL